MLLILLCYDENRVFQLEGTYNNCLVQLPD